MKRTRRVEVVRYSRRVTRNKGESATDVAAEQPTGDLVLIALESIALTPERVNCDGSGRQDIAANNPDTPTVTQ